MASCWFRPFAASLLLAGVLCAQYPGAEPPPEKLAPGFSAITVEECRAWLSILASDDFAGRESGTPGYDKAADFMAQRFEELGLEPIGDNGSYFQNVPFERSSVLPEATFLRADGTNTTIGADYGLAVKIRGGGRKIAVSAEVVFVAAKGRRVRLEDPSFLKGKIVIVSAGEDSFGARIRSQIANAKPAAYLLVREKVAKPGMDVRYDPKRRPIEESPPADARVEGEISRESASRLAEALGVEPKYLDPTAAGESAIHKVSAGKTATLQIEMKIEKIGVPNVVGRLEGSDPVLKSEYVIMGAHLDHVGVQGDGEICNGADDDGSGSTALLAAARAFTKNPTRPKRSLVFIAVCGEEKGLLGSSWYVEHPLVPIEKTVCELQMDMVGRDEEHHESENPTKETAAENLDTLHLIGSKKLSQELHDIAISCNTHMGFKFEYDQESVYSRSDHYNFARKGIPIIFFFAGFHRDYHQPTDDIEKINFTKIANTARLVYLTAFAVADQDRRIKVDKGPLKTVEPDTQPESRPER
jgi:Zn-dependent M28 family amino/carboxypeptidase